MPGPSRDGALDHTVVVMFENRSFDNLLGRLYEPGEVPSFEGVIGKDLSNPIPEWAEDGAGKGAVPYGVAENMDTPNPDPGEEYQRGTYDHVPPPPATPPDPKHPDGQMGFTFDRLGVRLPALAISPWIDERTVVNDVHHHTSVIRTMRERWDLGDPLTARDADAPDLAPLLSRDEPRAPEDWPDVAPQQVPDFDEDLVPRDAPLSPLATAAFHGFLALLKGLGGSAPDVGDGADLEGGEARNIVHGTAGNVFPGLRQADR